MPSKLIFIIFILGGYINVWAQKKELPLVLLPPESKKELKELLVNKQPGSSFKNLNFEAGEYELQSLALPLWTEVHKNVKLKMDPYSKIKIIVPNSQTESLQVELLNGQVYIISEGNIHFKIESLFSFNIAKGEFLVMFNEATKVTKFTSFVGAQRIQIVADDRENILAENQTLEFVPEWSDGELVYDFLLNNRKIPKFHLQKANADPKEKVEPSEWVAKEKNLKAKVKSNNNHSNNHQKTESKVQQICSKPNGSYSSCYWAQEKDRCVRYTCNLNGNWVQRTEFKKNRDCPSGPMLKPCVWLQD